MVPLTDSGVAGAALWFDAYDTEPAWLDIDLAEMSLPNIATWRR